MNVCRHSATASGFLAAFAVAAASIAQPAAPRQESLGPPMLPLILGTAALCTLIAFTVLRMFWRIRKRKKTPRL